MNRRKLYILAALVAGILSVSGFFLGGQSTTQAQKVNAAPNAQSPKPEVSTAVKYDLSPPLSQLIANQPANPSKPTPRERTEGFPNEKPLAINGFMPDPVVQTDFGFGPLAIPSPIVAFNGIANQWGVSPPDPNGDVSANYYVQMVNLGFQIYDKNGTPLTAVANNNTLWAGFGGPCQTENAGDPIVLHDQLADRWFLSQFSDSGAPFFNCVAVSATNDPRGSYHRYAFSAPAFPDYPKYGVWPDAYYLNTREGDTNLGSYALERDQMLIGNPAARMVRFSVGPGFAAGNGLLPSDLDGNTLPPAGSPNFFVGTQDDGGPYGAPSDAINLYKFHVDWANTANSTFTGPIVIPVAPFDSIFNPCSGRSCIPQPGTTNRIDILSYRQRPTFRLAYRNFGTHESLVTSQSVEAQPNVAGMRWYELRSPNATPVVFQQGTYSPDTLIHRWMGSIAMDTVGNMALGYSVSNGTDVFPGMRYTGRLASDPPGTMPQGEGIMINGTGSQTGSQRWGDYTSMNVDPSDDCTFWYTNQYVPTTSPSGWRGAVGSFKFPDCSQGTPTPTVTGTPPTATRTATAPTATRTATAPTATATACTAGAVLTGSLDASDPDFTRPNTFLQGGTCTTNGVHNYDVYTLQTIGGQVTASTCGGASWDTYLIIYQAPGGIPIPGFVPSGCTNAIAANDDACGLQSTVTANLVAGTYYVVVSEFSTPGGAYTVTVTAPGACGTPATATGTSTPGGPTASATVGTTSTATRTSTAGATATCVPGGGGTPGTWTVVAPLTTLRSRLGVAYVSATGKFYAAGGESTGGNRAIPIEEYDPVANTWTPRAQLNPGVSNTGAVGVGPYVYIPGGWIGTSSVTNMQRFDPVANTITQMAPLPAGATGVAVAAQGNRVYVLGGSTAGGAGTTNYIYDIGTNTWSTGAPVPTAVEYAAAASDGTYLYLIGGNTTNLNIVQRYDPAANIWTAAPTLLQGRGGPGAFFDGQRIWVVGGGWTTYLTSTEYYIPGSAGWVAGPALNTGVRTVGAAYGNSMAIKAGGWNGAYSAVAEKLPFSGGGNCPTGTPAVTATRTNTAVSTSTSTATTVASATRTNTAIVPTNTNTAVVPPTSTSTATTPPVATATVCVMPFTDVDIYNPFYIYIKCLYCRGIISGYADNTFRPYNDITRGQTAKIVSNSAGFSEPVSGQRYTDVPTTHTFYVWIMRLTNRNIATGYNTLAECPTGVPCFRPENPVTRGQLAKMASNAAGFSDVPPAGTLTFTDVPPGSTFYLFIERLARRGIINGYPCGVNPEEPCDAQRRPYYRPNHNITRGQASKIVANTFFPVNCTPGTPAILPGK